jgi:hypothetical protein
MEGSLMEVGFEVHPYISVICNVQITHFILMRPWPIYQNLTIMLKIATSNWSMLENG